MPVIAVVAAVASVSAAVTAVGAVLAGAALTATTVFSVITAVGAVTAAVGAVTGNQKLMKIGSVIGIVGGIGSLANSAGLFGSEGTFFGPNAATNAQAAADVAKQGVNSIPSGTTEIATSGAANAEALSGANMVQPPTAPTSSAGMISSGSPSVTDPGFGAVDAAAPSQMVTPTSPQFGATQAPAPVTDLSTTATGGTIDGRVAPVSSGQVAPVDNANAGPTPGIRTGNAFTQMMDGLRGNKELTSLIGNTMQGYGQSYAAGKQYDLNKQELDNRIRNQGVMPGTMPDVGAGLQRRDPSGMISRGG